MAKRLIIPVLVTLLTCGTLAAQSESTPAAVDRTRLDALRSEGYESLYNLDYEGARRRFREMMDLAPDDPAGPQCFAASLWLQQLNESWELKATLYSTDSYANAKRAVDKRQSDEFRQWTRRTKMLSQARLRRDPRDVEALYFLGAAEGLEAAFAAGVERKFMVALRSASDSVDHHRAVLKLNRDYHDAELTIGLYDYIVGSLSLPVKVLAGTMGVRGSKKRGLETLERVSKEGHWARDIARVLLVDLYKREKRWNDAVVVSRVLSDKYPHNYLFKLQIADALVSQIVSLRKENNSSPSNGQNEERAVMTIFDSLLVDRSDLERSGAATIDLIQFRYGEALLSLGHPDRAVKEFLQVITRSGGEPRLKTMCRLRDAQALDVAGRRKEALAEYRAVLGSPDINQAHEEARRGLREVFKGISPTRRD
jgi:hypothetical protein